MTMHQTQTRIDAKADREWLTVDELAEWFGVEKHVIYWMNQTGAAPPRYRIGRELRYRRSEVEQWLAERRQAAGQPA
jgi:excisionase family DNA binding protein